MKVTTKLSPIEEHYKRRVEDQLGAVWYRLTKIHLDSLQLGTVETTFEILPAGGAVRNLQIKSNAGGRMDELICSKSD